jgi:solute carrier family 25 oxoglutarate transporter 11
MKEDLLRVAIGGASGVISTAVIMPIDTFKVQIQVQSEALGLAGQGGQVGYLRLAQRIIRDRGLASLYGGLSSALARQLFYTSARLGSYSILKARLASESGPASFFARVGLSILSGCLGAMVGNPFDVVLVRRQSSLLEGGRREGVVRAVARLAREEGVAGLWRGLGVTMVRVSLINIGQLAAF